MDKQETIDFIKLQIAGAQTPIKQLKIMQLAWQAGGEPFKEDLEKVSVKLGSWLAAEQSLLNQLTELES